MCVREQYTDFYDNENLTGEYPQYQAFVDAYPVQKKIRKLESVNLYCVGEIVH